MDWQTLLLGILIGWLLGWAFELFYFRGKRMFPLGGDVTTAAGSATTAGAASSDGEADAGA